jgi:cell division protein FtsW
MLSSAGVVEGQKKFNSPSYFFKHQLLFGVLPGLILFYIASKINFKFWKKVAFPSLLVVLGLMVLIFFPKFGVTINGAQRWLALGPFTFQPAEFLKLALVIYLGAWFSQRGGQALSNWSYSVVPFLLVLGFVGLLLILQPDIKTLSIVVLISLSVYFFAGAKWIHLMIFLLIFSVILGFLSLEPYRWNRILAYLNPSADKQGVSYHINQALLSVGSGGLFGVGFGQSQQKINYLPEPVGDSIFAVITEELGLAGGGTVVILFVSLVLVLVYIAQNTHDRFGRLFVLGTAVWIACQAFINIGAIINLIPLTGVPLPFFSFGSSSLVALFVALGITVNISRHNIAHS